MDRILVTNMRSLLLLLLLSIYTTACTKIAPEGPDLPLARNANATAADAASPATCQPRFPDVRGWLGADAAFSVPFDGASDAKSLWLFGDSFIAATSPSDSAPHPPRRTYPFIHNSIGLSHCGEGDHWTFTPFWAKGPDGSARAFFRPDKGADWVRSASTSRGESAYYWPFDGFFDEGALYVGLLRVIPGEAAGEFNLPFRLMGMDLARVSNPNASPEAWRIKLLPWSEDPRLIPGSALVVHEGFVYAFTFLNHEVGRSPRTLARIPLEALRTDEPTPSSRLTYLAPNRRWVRDPEPNAVELLMTDNATEMSVHFDEASQMWIAVYASPQPTGDEGAPTLIFARRSPLLEGPWSAPHSIFTIPETLPDTEGRFDENLFCYAGKAHPQFSPPGELVLSYVCNLFARNPAETSAILRRLAESPDLYRAKIVRVPMPTWTN